MMWTMLIVLGLFILVFGGCLVVIACIRSAQISKQLEEELVAFEAGIPQKICEI